MTRGGRTSIDGLDGRADEDGRERSLFVLGKKGQGVDHRSQMLRQALEYVFTEGGVGEGELGEGRAPD